MREVRRKNYFNYSFRSDYGQRLDDEIILPLYVKMAVYHLFRLEV